MTQKMKKDPYLLMGAICGDCVGSRFEWKSYKDIPENFHLFTSKSRFTDDTCLTVAIADAVLHDGNYEKCLKSYTRRNPDLGFGKMYKKWALDKSTVSQPIESYANGAAMRLSPIPLFFTDLQKIYLETVRSTAVTHNHPKALDASMLLSTAIFLCRSIKDKQYIRKVLNHNFNYDYEQFADLNEDAKYKVKNSLTAESAVNFALDCFFKSNSYVETIRTAILAGGDTDTIAAISGSIALAFYETMPEELYNKCWDLLPPRYKKVIEKFDNASKNVK